MERIQVGYAQAHLPALLERVEQGEELVIARHNKVIARLVPAPLHAPQHKPLNRHGQWVDWICRISWKKGQCCLWMTSIWIKRNALP